MLLRLLHQSGQETRCLMKENPSEQIQLFSMLPKLLSFWA